MRTSQKCFVRIESSVSSGYRPRFRPRRLTVPTDSELPWDSFSREPKDPLFKKFITQRKDRLRAMRVGAVSLGAVPHERTVASAFQYVLDFCRIHGLMETDQSEKNVSTGSLKERSGLTQKATNTLALSIGGGEIAVDVMPTRSRRLNEISLKSKAFRWWSLLEKTPLDYPIHGALAIRGKALIQHTLARSLYQVYPRLRSASVEDILKPLTSHTASCRIATSIYLAQVCNIETDVGLWRELDFVLARRDHVQQLLKAHKQRLKQDSSSQQFWLYHRQMRIVNQKLRGFPASEQELRPRIEWLDQLLAAFIAFVEIAHGTATVERLILNLFMPDLHNHSLDESLQHPLDKKSERALLHRESSTRKWGTEAPRDGFGEQDIQQLPNVPPFLLKLIHPRNALKEIQIILRYSPHTPNSLRDVKLKAESRQDAETPLIGSENFHEHSAEDNKHAPRTMTVALLAGSSVLGVAKGEHSQHALQRAALNFVHRYYTRK